MIKYTKENPRITVKVYDSDSEELLITITDRNWMNVGEIFPSHTMTSLVSEEIKKKKIKPPQKILVMVAEEYSLDEEE
jgi:hypothetical protein